jgi:hypothetical protein
MNLLTNFPVNSLSFGNVSVNILRELYKKKQEISFFPIGDEVDINAYDKLSEDFKSWLQSSVDSRYETISRDHVALKLWHIMGSEQRYCKKQVLFTFHETSELTATEKNILKLQDHVLVSSSYSKEVMNGAGIENVSVVNLGFDTDFCKTNKPYLPDKIHFGIMGKFEKRKHTAKIITNWLKKFGNDPKYQLTCAVVNPFLSQQKLQHSIARIFDGKRYNNINFIPYLKTNSEVNDYLNSIDIDLGGMSGGEGWNLPAFNATALGKWSLVLNATAHKDWATNENSLLLEPSGKMESEDKTFFVKGGPFNQGEFYDFNDDDFISLLEKSLNFAKKENTEGLKLQSTHSYSSVVEKIEHSLSS